MCITRIPLTELASDTPSSWIVPKWPQNMSDTGPNRYDVKDVNTCKISKSISILEKQTNKQTKNQWTTIFRHHSVFLINDVHV